MCTPLTIVLLWLSQTNCCTMASLFDKEVLDEEMDIGDGVYGWDDCMPI